MGESKDLSEEINRKIEEIQTKVLSGEIALLDLELVPIFENIKDTLDIGNINKYSLAFKNVFQLLVEKFEELKILINNLDKKEGFFQYLKSNPNDSEVYNLFNGCWIKPFNIESLSLNFLNSSREKLSKGEGYSVTIEHLEKVIIKHNFLLEVPEQKFTEKIMNFYNTIKNKFPCSFDDVFENEQDQIKIYENFVYLLHLLQMGKINYQKETNFLYI
ncbi:MAG: hypothetical protein KAX18_00370 [Candidatus Lokiarchaeota archaeon]|nr:hypothetical protein [Candidatus Lokiarchaeota archaeon]